MEKKKIIVFGGCFNPPLNSHFSLAEQIVNEYENIEKVIFVPVNSKYEKNDLIGNEDRFEMLKRVCNKNKKFEVSRVEIESDRPLYTVETLEKLQKEYLEFEIAFATGSDNLKILSTWKKADELVKNFKVFVLERDKDNVDEIIENDEFLKENKEAFIKAKKSIRSNMSSTFVRDKISRGRSIRYLTPDEVIAYIEEHNLYKK